MTWDLAWYGVLTVVLITGWLINIVGLPGLWLMIGAAGIYGWVTRWDYVGLWTLLVLVGLGLAAELVEFIAGSAGAKRFGGSTRAAWGALLGGLIGGIFLSIPIPLLGAIIGACLGAFLGALIAEFTVHGRTGQSLQVGWGAAQGRFLGIMSKLGFGLVILVIALWMAAPLPSRRRQVLPMRTPVARISAEASSIEALCCSGSPERVCSGSEVAAGERRTT